jgi:hypothetical protein
MVFSRLRLKPIGTGPDVVQRGEMKKDIEIHFQIEVLSFLPHTRPVVYGSQLPPQT